MSVESQKSGFESEDHFAKPVTQWPIDTQEIGVIWPNGRTTLRVIHGGALQVLLNEANQENPVSMDDLCRRLYGKVEPIYNLPATKRVVEKVNTQIAPTGLGVRSSYRKPDSYYIGLPEQERHERLTAVIKQREELLENIYKSSHYSIGRRGFVARKVKTSLERLNKERAAVEQSLRERHIGVSREGDTNDSPSVGDRLQGVIFDAAGAAYNRFAKKPRRSVTQVPPMVDVPGESLPLQQVEPVSPVNKPKPEVLPVVEKRFGTLTPLEIGLIVAVLDNRRDKFLQFLQKHDITSFDEAAFARLISQARQLTIPFDSVTRTEEQKNRATERRIQMAFKKIEEIVINPKRDEIFDDAFNKDQDVYALLMWMTDVIPAVRVSSPQRASFIRALDTVLSGLPETRGVASREEQSKQPLQTQTELVDTRAISPSPDEGPKQAIEKRHPEIRIIIDQYFERIEEKLLWTGEVGPARLTREFPNITETTQNNNRDYVPTRIENGFEYYNAISIATLLYLKEYAQQLSLSPQLRRQVAKIVEDVYNTRLNEKRNNKNSENF